MLKMGKSQGKRRGFDEVAETQSRSSRRSSGIAEAETRRLPRNSTRQWAILVETDEDMDLPPDDNDLGTLREQE
jgi:hypothetical protein